MYRNVPKIILIFDNLYNRIYTIKLTIELDLLAFFELYF